MKKLLLVGFVVVSTSVGAWSPCEQPPEMPARDLHRVMDESYLQIDDEKLKFDFTRPASTVEAPLVLLIHGGAWAFGTKDKYRDDSRRLATLGYASAAINYRLVRVTQNRFPAAVEDVRCAVRYLKKNSARLGFDPSRIVAWGDSAGGHLAAMLGTSLHENGLDGVHCQNYESDPSIQGAISFYGVLDTRDTSTVTFAHRGVLFNFLGFWPETNPARAALASPQAHIDSHTVPFHLVHGDKDNVVPAKSSRDFSAALTAAGHANEYIELPGENHGFDFFSDRLNFQASMCSSLEFLRKTLFGASAT